MQGSKLSPSLFRFYIADMPRPTDPVKRVCYTDDLTVWASRTAYLKHNYFLISATKSSVTLLTPDRHQTNTHTNILIVDSRLPLVKCPRILGVYLAPSLSFNKLSHYVADGYPPPTSNSERKIELGRNAQPLCRLRHDVKHLFVCPAHPTTITPSDLMEQTGGRCLGTQLS